MLEGFSIPKERVEIAENRVLEPFKKLFQWCPMAFTGYAKVDPNHLCIAGVRLLKRNGGLFDINRAGDAGALCAIC
ncbi:MULTISPECIES: hypothetical protein [Pseudomonas]|uniref:hypothetical protein n=1 Tax=Pseudomonas TaxID=286 RepID=UPI0011B0226C|nr:MULTISPECIES: hypothetical protein [Pseudomonas]